MKNKLLLAIFFIGAQPLFSQINTWAWASSPTGYANNNDVNGSLCAADTLGNVYVTSAFSSPTMEVGNVTLNRSDTSAVDNIYVAKYNSAGDVQWAKSAGGDGLAFARGIAVDPAGDVYLGGWFFGDSLVFENTVLYGGRIFVILQSGVFFIAKYDPNGNLLWAKTQDTASQGGLVVNSIGCDAAGNLYAAGLVSAPNGPLVYEGQTLIASPTNIDIALVKFDANGHSVWGQNTNATGTESIAFAVNTDAAGNSAITGYFENSATFGSTTLTGQVNGENFFVARYDSSGNALWAHGASIQGFNEGWAINTDKTGNIYVAGTFTADSFSLGSTTLRAEDVSGNSNVFLAKFTAAGAFGWLTAAGTAGTNGPTSIAFDHTGKVLVTGTTSDLKFIVGPDTLPCQGSGDIFLEDFNPASGFLQGDETYGPGGFHQGAYACNNPQGNIFLTGMFSSGLLLGSYAFTNIDTPAYRTFIASQGYHAPSGLQGITANEFLNIYPNPSPGTFTVTLPEGGNTVSIFNTLGQVIETRQLQGPASAGFSLTTSGIYLIQVKTGVGIVTQKLVITR